MEEKTNNLVDLNESDLIEKENVSLTLSDAKKMTMRFSAINSGFKSRTTSGNMEMSISIISNPINNKPLIYIVNRGNGDGFLVLSASKTESPVLAYSEKGSFDPENNLYTKDFISQFKYRISSVTETDMDSLRRIHAAEWAVFEKSTKQAPSRASNAEIEKMIETQIAKKKAQGYSYIGKITAAQYYLNSSDYQNLLKDIKEHSNPEYDYEYVSLFFIKSWEFETIGPLIGTEWNQYYPFNIDAPNGYAGCVPIAIAQIAYYHKYPNKYDWSKIYNVPVANDAFTYFIKDIRNLCDVEYNNDGTSSNYKKAKKALNSLGYNISEGGYPSFDKFRAEIKGRRPIYIRGENSSGVGHAWVCEGYKNIKYEGVISMVIDPKWGLPDEPGTPYFDYNVNVYPPSSMDQELYGEFFYMNLGWRRDPYTNETNNGWYRSNTHNASKPENDFLKDQKTIFIKKP